MITAMQIARRVARALVPPALRPAVRRLLGRAAPPLAPGDLPFQYPFWQIMKADPSPRPQYRWGVLCAASLARNLGYPRISVLELGVAGGNGLIELERAAADAEQRSGVKIDVYGLDTGSGMTRPQDHRDLPQLWGEGFYRMDVEALKRRLTRAQLLLGPVERTMPGFIASAPAPVGFVSFDMDMYHPTMAAFALFRAAPALLLPRVTCYFDDLIGFSHGDFNGERLAIADFNRVDDPRKISRTYGLRYVLDLDQWWVEQMFMLHAFDHPRYSEHDGWNPLVELPLNPA